MSRYQTHASNIRVSVAFDTPTVFAGEDVACSITFRNTARTADEQQQQGAAATSPGGSSRGTRKVTPILPRPGNGGSRQSSYGAGPNIPAHLRKGQGHRVVNSVGGGGGEAVGAGSKPRHGRSLSILSMGTDVGTVVSMPRGGERAGRGGHERTISVQTAPRQVSGQGSPRVSAPVITEQDVDGQATIRPKRPTSRRPLSEAKKSPGILHQDFKFPAAPPPDDNLLDPESAISPKTDSLPFRALSPPLSDSNSSPANPIARVLSQSSANDSPRSSIDLFSEAQSTHSDETMASEYVPQQMARLMPRPNHVRNNSRLGVREPPRGPETIMMGYAQINGSFTLEGSLVNQAPFEEIKRKGVVGSHGGGGVVGVERTKRDSGLFGAFGWGNIGESIGGLLGADAPSSIKEMGRIASSKSIPLVTTPPSILFVDLRLAPGESKSYSYRFTMPRGLPPTHKGRSIKVAYHLVIGTQRAGKGKEQQVKSVEIPFRLFGSVDHTGDILGHDLMSSYILLRDQAKTSAVDPSASKPMLKPKKPPDADGEKEFMDYISALLDKSTSNNTNGLLSPTSPLGSPNLPRSRSPNNGRRASSVGEHRTSQAELVDFAILRSNLSSDKNLSNKFDIARSGRHVATLHITRPAYRLGETIHLVAEFKGAVIPTYAVQVALETRETVDAAIAMRSASSIYRYTRKVHAYDAANALFAKRLSFALGIPGNGTPEFVTSGISLDWRIRVEFVTPRLSQGLEGEELLEEIAEDERGMVLQGVEGLRVESFEVAVPVRVYGASGVRAGEVDVEGVPV